MYFILSLYRKWDFEDNFGITLMNVHIPYFFSYKMEFFSFQNNLKNLNLSDKTGLGLWDCLGRVKLLAKFQKWTDLVTGSHSREGKPPSY